MTERERLSTTLGILLAGLLEAERETAESERRPKVRASSGEYRWDEATFTWLADTGSDRDPAPR
jgi:hypothetical protein